MSRDLQEREEILLRQVTEAIEPHGLQMEVLRREPPVREARTDPEIRIRYPEGAIDLRAEIEPRVSTSDFGPAVGRLRRHGSAAVLITDYVSPSLAERLREQEVFFLDAAGNAFLSHPGLYVWVTGRRNPSATRQSKERVRAFQPSGLKLIFALLCKPELVEADYRTLAKIADTALGTVHLVLRDLVAEHFVRRIGRTRRVLVRPKELLDAWVQPFVRDLRPRLLLGRFSSSNLDWWQQIDISKYAAFWGGEPAGARLTGFLKPGTLTIYADKLPAALLVHQRLTREETGRVEIFKKFWSLPDDSAGTGLVPSILAYADLLAIADARTLESAERLFEQHIDGSFQSYLAHTAG